MTQGRVVYVRLQNESGAPVTAGTPVVLNSLDSSFSISSIINDKSVLGVAAHDFAVAEFGLVQTGGIAAVTVDSCQQGHWLVQSATLGVLTDSGGVFDAASRPPFGACGVAMEAGGPGLVQVLLLPGAGNYGVINYDPDVPPAAPSATDDEFTAGSLSGSWTSESPTVLDLPFKGYVHMEDASGSAKGIYETFAPGANPFTVAVKISGDVGQDASAKILVSVKTAAGADIVTLGVANGGLWYAAAAAIGGGSATGSINGDGNLGVHYFAIQRDGTTNYLLWVSNDGITWRKVETFSQAGTVGRVYLQVLASAGNSVAYFDFVRMFASETTVIGFQ